MTFRDHPAFPVPATLSLPGTLPGPTASAQQRATRIHRNIIASILRAADLGTAPLHAFNETIDFRTNEWNDAHTQDVLDTLTAAGYSATVDGPMVRITGPYPETAYDHLDAAAAAVLDAAATERANRVTPADWEHTGDTLLLLANATPDVPAPLAALLHLWLKAMPANYMPPPRLAERFRTQIDAAVPTPEQAAEPAPVLSLHARTVGEIAFRQCKGVTVTGTDGHLAVIVTGPAKTDATSDPIAAAAEALTSYGYTNTVTRSRITLDDPLPAHVYETLTADEQAIIDMMLSGAYPSHVRGDDALDAAWAALGESIGRLAHATPGHLGVQVLGNLWATERPAGALPTDETNRLMYDHLVLLGRVDPTMTPRPSSR